MSRMAILLSTDLLIYASVFCCGSVRAFMAMRENAHVALHGKLFIIVQIVAQFMLPYDTTWFLTWIF